MNIDRIDILNREKFVDNVFTVIETLSANNKSCTFAINGKWGSGKSFVLDMLEEKLEIQQREETAFDKYAVFHYNCWQYDYYDEPLYAIVSAMYDWIKSNESKLGKIAKTLLLYALIMMGQTTKRAVLNVIKSFTKIDFQGLHNETKQIINKINNQDKLDDEFYTVQDSIFFTRDILSKIAKEQTVVIVVDELDRCLPEYSIKVLERLHHVFDGIENLIVILAVDKEHLNNTVGQIFGFEEDNKTADIDSYLAKFIDFETKLNIGNIDENYKLKYAEYFSKFNKDSDSAGVTEYLSALFENIDSRKRDKIFEKALLIHNLIFEEKVDVSIMCVELLFVTYYAVVKNIYKIESNTFLIKKASQYFPKFSTVFDQKIVKYANLRRRQNVLDGRVVGYSATCGNNIKHQILYYISRHPRFSLEFYLDDQNTKELEVNAERIKEFYDFLEIIK